MKFIRSWIKCAWWEQRASFNTSYRIQLDDWRCAVHPAKRGARSWVALTSSTSEKQHFSCSKQFAVEYTNNGMKETRRPDILLFVNGIPLCIIELKIRQTPMRRFMTPMSKSRFDIGVIFPIYSITALGVHFRRCENRLGIPSYCLMSIFTHGGV